MKIHPVIQNSTNFNPTKKTHQMDIATMCERITNNKLTLPLYQRDLSWTLQKSVDLFNYQLLGKAPVAPISINEIGDQAEEYVPQISFIERELISDSQIRGNHLSVVDGQQRLTTNYKAYVNDDAFRNIVIDVTKGKFLLIQGGISKSQIPVGILFNKDESLLTDYLQEKNTFTELFSLLIRIRTKIRSYNYTINIADDLSEDEQIEWFEVLNNAGSRVTALQMRFSKLKMYDIDIYNDYTTPFREKASEYGFEKLFTPHSTNVSYPIAALNPAYEVIDRNGAHHTNHAPIPSDTKEDIITKLDLYKISSIINLTLESLENALNFIIDNNMSKYINRMDHLLYITGFFSFKNGASLTSNEKSNLINWIKSISFTNLSNSQRRAIFSSLISYVE